MRWRWRRSIVNDRGNVSVFYQISCLSKAKFVPVCFVVQFYSDPKLIVKEPRKPIWEWDCALVPRWDESNQIMFFDLMVSRKGKLVFDLVVDVDDIVLVFRRVCSGTGRDDDCRWWAWRWRRRWRRRGRGRRRRRQRGRRRKWRRRWDRWRCRRRRCARADVVARVARVIAVVRRRSGLEHVASRSRKRVRGAACTARSSWNTVAAVRSYVTVVMDTVARDRVSSVEVLHWLVVVSVARIAFSVDDSRSDGTCSERDGRARDHGC